MADVQQQLSALLGRQVRLIRKTDDVPSRISMIDTIAAITGKNANHSAEVLRELCRRHPEVHAGTANYKFVGKGQKSTPVTHVRGIIEVGGGTKLRDVISQHEWDVA